MVLVQDMMTRDPISVPQDASVDVAIDLMVEKNISGVPVVDEDDLPVGLITEFDVLQFYGKYQGDCPTRYHTCRDTMSREIRTIREEASLEVAAKIFQAASLRRLLVLSGNRLVGILSRRDVVRSIRDGRLSPAAL
jgi:CBS domain-containing protein